MQCSFQNCIVEISLFFPLHNAQCVHKAHAGPFSIQAIPCGEPCTRSTACPLHDPECAWVYERPRIKPAHTCAGHVFSACGIDSCLKWFMSGAGGSAAFDVDVKPPSHPSLHLSSASCCSPFLSIRLPFFLSSFLPLFPSLTPTLSLSASHTLARTEVSVPSTHPMRD